MLCWRARRSPQCSAGAPTPSARSFLSFSLFSALSNPLPHLGKKNALSRFNPFLTVSDKKVNRTKQKGKHGRRNKEQEKRKHVTSFNALDCLRHAGKERRARVEERNYYCYFARDSLFFILFVCVVVLVCGRVSSSFRCCALRKVSGWEGGRNDTDGRALHTRLTKTRGQTTRHTHSEKEGEPGGTIRKKSNTRQPSKIQSLSVFTHPVSLSSFYLFFFLGTTRRRE